MDPRLTGCRDGFWEGEAPAESRNRNSHPERLGGSLALSDNDQRGWFAASAVDLGATKRGGLVWSASSQVLK